MSIAFIFINLIFVIITLTHSHDDLLLFDEFSYKFNLLNPDDWDRWHLTHDYSNIEHQYTNLFGSKITSNHRRLIRNENDNLLSDNTDYAFTCTNTVPMIFKKLCIHWQMNEGFSMKYRKPLSMDGIDETNWYYNHLNHVTDHGINNDKISDAAAANRYYNILGSNSDDVISIGDDSNWNEINYANSLSSFTLNNPLNNNHYLKNFAKGSFKQCRYSLRMKECIHYHLPSKTLTVKLKIAKGRVPRENAKQLTPIFNAGQVLPDNLYDNDNSDDGDDLNEFISSASKYINNQYNNEGDESKVFSNGGYGVFLL